MDSILKTETNDVRAKPSLLPLFLDSESCMGELNHLGVFIGTQYGAFQVAAEVTLRDEMLSAADLDVLSLPALDNGRSKGAKR